MVNFGQKLLAWQYSPWAKHYIDYNHLKDVLKNEYKQRNSNDSLSTWLSGNAVSSEFLSALYLQTEKVSFFVLQESGKITEELSQCRQELFKGISTTDISELTSLEDQYVRAGFSILELVRFVDLNMTGFRKILKKHDKMAHTKLSLSYLAPRSGTGFSMTNASAFQYQLDKPIGEDLDLLSVGNQLLQPLLTSDVISALAAAYEAGSEELRRHWVQYEMNHPTSTKTTKPFGKQSRSRTTPNLQLESYSYKDQRQQQQSSTNRSHSDLVDIHDIHADSPYRKTKTETSPAQILFQIYVAQSRLHQTNHFIKLLAAPMMSDVQEEEGDETLSSTGENLLRRPSKFSAWLNLLSTFLYMTNYYIVAPTSATYADKLGSDSSIASIIIGMTSLAALVSTLLYSWWTSHSYKAALIFASTCSLIGNLLYAAGLPYQSINLVMLGRLLNGFGSARSINRRYVADSYSPAERTAASAAFVTATALGMATGPAIAALLHVATESSDSVFWQPENAPGWLMFVIWSIFLLCLIWKFEDPPRHTRPNKQASGGMPGTLDEKRPLLGHNDPPDEESPDNACSSIPVVITLCVYMVLKMVLEAVLSSEGNLTAYYFGWHGNIMGAHLSILALLIIPVNYCVASLARWYFDRELIIGLLVAMLMGCLIIYQYQESRHDYTLWQYLIGSAILFVCASALEAPNMSLLSKIIPRKWSKGIINVGLLATESGTFGRVLGDALLAATARYGLEGMLNDAFGTFGLTILASLVSCIIFYGHLEPLDKDD